MNPDNPYKPQEPQETPATQPVGSAYGSSNFPSILSHPEPQTPVQQQAPPQPAPVEPFNQPAAQPSPQPLSTPGGAPNGQFSVDYLNQIAPKNQSVVNRFAVLGLIGGILMALIVAVVIMVNAGGPNFNAQTSSIQARIASLQKVVIAQQPHLKENSISEANAALGSSLTSMNTDLTALMKSKGIKVSGNDQKTIKASEKTYTTTLAKKLEDSYQRGTLDRTYTAQMTYELTLLRSKLKNLKTSSNSESVDTFCDSGIKNIDALLTSYAKFAATK